MLFPFDFCVASSPCFPGVAPVDPRRLAPDRVPDLVPDPCEAFRGGLIEYRKSAAIYKQSFNRSHITAPFIKLPDCFCIKGGGAAHVREKLVEYNSKIFVVVADSSKAVETIGTKFPVPVEIISEARIPVTNALNALGAKCVLREGVRKCGPVITDNGNQILDCTWEKPIDVAQMEDKINSIVGVVENGLFSKNKPIVFVATPDDKVEMRNWH